MSTEPPNVPQPKPLGGILSLFSYWDKPLKIDTKMNKVQDIDIQESSLKIDKYDELIDMNDHDGELLSQSWKSISAIAPLLSSAIKAKNSQLYMNLCRSIGNDTSYDSLDNNANENSNHYGYSDTDSNNNYNGFNNLSSDIAKTSYNASVATSSTNNPSYSPNNPSFNTNNPSFSTRDIFFNTNLSPLPSSISIDSNNINPSSTKLSPPSTKLSPSSTKLSSTTTISTPLPSTSSTYSTNTKPLSAIDINTHIHSTISTPSNNNDDNSDNKYDNRNNSNIYDIENDKKYLVKNKYDYNDTGTNDYEKNETKKASKSVKFVKCAKNRLDETPVSFTSNGKNGMIITSAKKSSSLNQKNGNYDNVSNNDKLNKTSNSRNKLDLDAPVDPPPNSDKYELKLLLDLAKLGIYLPTFFTPLLSFFLSLILCSYSIYIQIYLCKYIYVNKFMYICKQMYVYTGTDTSVEGAIPTKNDYVVSNEELGIYLSCQLFSLLSFFL
jgi:hypothetical protein